MAVAAKVSSNSQSPKRSQGLFPMYVYIGSLIGHPSRDLFSLSPVCKSGTSSFQECFLHDRPGHFLNKNYRISVMASQMVLWPSISSLSILIHIQPPDWLSTLFCFMTSLSQNLPWLFLFTGLQHLAFDVFPYLASTTFSILTLCDLPLNPFLCFDWVCPSLFLLLVSIYSLFCTWKTSRVSQSPSSRQDSGTQKP